ncbi:MAG TPA: ATP-binding protein [Actinomycetota bacterium]|nr:ATP-binding protein [Actinomycetota bacterium]
MEISGRPLLDTKPDQALVAGRAADAAEIIAAAERRRNVLVLGERGSGKTTLLRQVAYELRQRHPEAPPAFVSGAQAGTARELVNLIGRRLGLVPAAAGSAEEEVDLAEAVHRLQGAAVKKGRRTILIDEPPPAAAQTLFGRLRDEVWQLPFVWIVAAGQRDAGTYREPPIDAFFDRVTVLAPLDREAQAALLTARAGEAGRRLARKIDEGNPRRLLAMARAALQDGSAPADLSAGQARRQAAAAELGRPASMLLAELEALGAASASDPALLERLGWTRTRAVQVLGQLHAAGLVSASEVKGAAGRPRKVYRPAELAAAGLAAAGRPPVGRSRGASGK